MNKTCFRLPFYSIFSLLTKRPWMYSQFSTWHCRKKKTNECGQVIYLRNTNHVKSFEAGQISLRVFYQDVEVCEPSKYYF